MKIRDFIEKLDSFPGIYIHLHDFPDPDAIGAASGLQAILKSYNYKSDIIYNGTIFRESALQMIAELDISIKKIQDMEINENYLIIIVDGQPSNANVAHIGVDNRKYCVIDHHPKDIDAEYFYEDIREDYGSTATIISEYARDLGLVLDIKVASAMFIGLSIDTMNLSRSENRADLEAFYYLYKISDRKFCNYILRNNFEYNDLRSFERAIKKKKVYKSFVFLDLGHDCSGSLLGIIADFFLRVREFDFVVTLAYNNNRINISVRSEIEKLDVGKITKSVVKGFGTGGGHSYMAGGVVLCTKLEVEHFKKNIYYRFKKEYRKALVRYSVFTKHKK